MANPEHLAILKQGVKVWNEWRKKDSHTVADLGGANLSLASLDSVDFWLTDMSNADLSGSNLSHARIHVAWLNEANLYNSFLINTDLIETNLTNANFQETSLHRARFEKVNFNGTDFARARFGETIFVDTDLSTAKSLVNANHLMASTIGIDTIYRSGGNIPEVFLRGCGVPVTFITYARSLVGKPLDFYSCFISHSSKDKRFCDR
jgi:hypothetical protein